jgi:hypothetical protein
MPLIGARATASRCYFGEKEKPGAPTITSSTPGASFLSIAFDAPTFNGGITVTRYEQAFSTNNSTWSEWALASSSTSPPTSPVTISGLTNGQAYYVKIRAVNSMGPGPESNVWNTTTTPRTTPDAPTLSSVTRGYRQLTVAFTAPTFNGGSAITDYEFSTNNGTSWTSMTQSGTTDYVITGLADFTSYNVRVRAVNAAGPSSSSNMLVGITAGLTNAPISLSAGSNGVSESPLSWTAPESNGSPISDYIIQRSIFPNFPSEDVVTFPDGVSTNTSATVTGLSASITYYFRVAAVNQVGQSGWSSVVSATTAGVPSQVGTPTSSSGDRVFTISWSTPASNGSNITSYTVQYSSNGGSSWSTAETFSSGSTEFTNRTKSWVLNNGVSYVGRVLATNAVGNGAYSSASTARTPVFAAPVLTANASYNSESEPNVRRITWSVDPTDVRSSTSSAGTTTRVYLQRMTADGTWSNPSHAEQLIATYTGNAANGSFGTSFTTSGTVERDQQYRIRAEQFSSEDTGYIVGTSWINLAVIGLQSRQPPNVESWQDNGAADVYTMTALVSGSSYIKTSSGMPGTNATTVGSVQYTITSFRVTATGRSVTSASTTSRSFYLEHSGTSTTFTASETSDPSNLWPGASNNTMSYTWNITDIAYGNAGAGIVRIRGLGSTTYSTNPDQRIDVTIIAKGTKRTRISTTPALITW